MIQKMKSLASGARHLWKVSASLGLNFVDRVKYELSWYLSRHPFLMALAPSQMIVKLPCGMRALIRPNGVDCRTLADVFGGVYECRADGVKHILDLGSNVGIATLFFASRFPDAEIACVEPSPGNLALLQRVIRMNDVHGTVFEGVIGPAAGEAELHVDCNADMFSLTPASVSANTLKVRQFAVPEILTALGWDDIDLLKIDIEGYEKVLLGEDNGWLSRVRTIVGEAHGHANYGIAELRSDLEPFGFEVSLQKFDPEHGGTIFQAFKKSRRAAVAVV
jgi:FkbM family methyltransferase